MGAGRPLRFKDINDLEERIINYFTKTPDEEITITGLCLTLGINKDTFYEYAKRKEYKELIDYARLVVENSYEKSLRKNGRTGDIFALKNFGWVDKQEISNEVSINSYANLTEEELHKLAGEQYDT